MLVMNCLIGIQVIGRISFLGLLQVMKRDLIFGIQKVNKNQYSGNKSSAPLKKFRTQSSAGKIMATVFWDVDGVIVIDYLSTKNYYHWTALCYPTTTVVVIH